MLDNGFRKFFLYRNIEKYLPLLYPILMPILTLYSFKIPTHSFQESLTYWAFIGLIQLMLLFIVQKTIHINRYNQYVRWLIALVLGIATIYTYMYIENNWLYITAAFTEQNKWPHILRVSLNIPILIAIIESIKSARERKKIMIDNISLANENAKAQYNLLLQQINPHFLFNCLTVLQSMVHTKDSRTIAFITQFADVYHQTLKTEKGTVTLREELAFFNAYMYLMQMRQENAVTITVEIEDESLDYYLPTFSLQLLAENCIKHNIVSIAKPLNIHLYQKNKQTLTISNNFQPKIQPVESFGIGISNLKKRYALEGISGGLTIEKNETTYATTLKLI